ncbi:MAG: helix-turn-helix transcriptional regulator [Rhodospirillaceae bacterium]|jgi:phage repressor protein C with HTH and peptisase S24 domain|nr:helix-turn-helix transcriptional regulator [Rhodospirillaceae bacterium]MBT6405231.1 helix-turn-helix transcriptional regulator [Rhodospirillaceae bacterium]MBT6536733.1 helix-turn-helix transcriptional regulator [Rhodospirillaceae bacterium]MBT7361285.1 helix-turn-helix transcriptional regulator [Rhodospirillaceae bacterium]
MFDAMDPALDWIRNGLGKPGKNQRSLAGALGVDPSAISRLLAGTRQLRAAELPVVAAYLEAEIPADFSPATTSKPTPSMEAPAPTRTSGASTRDLPVMGTAVGGSAGESGGMFLMNGEIHDYVERPPSLRGVASAYAVYISDTSMVPRYFPGETLHVHPGRAVVRGEDTFVVVQLRPDAEGEPPRAVVKQFVRQTADALYLKQFNPATELVFPLDQVESLHLIIWAGRG